MACGARLSLGAGRRVPCSGGFLHAKLQALDTRNSALGAGFAFGADQHEGCGLAGFHDIPTRGAAVMSFSERSVGSW